MNCQANELPDHLAGQEAFLEDLAGQEAAPPRPPAKPGGLRPPDPLVIFNIMNCQANEFPS